MLYFALKENLNIKADPTLGYPPISILRPIKGLDEFSEENYRSWFEQEYDNDVEFIFSFQDPKDEAIDLVEKLKAEYSHLNIKIIIKQIREGYSGKMSSLVNGVEHAQYDYFIFTDADTYAPAGVLKKLVSEQLRTGAVVSCTPFVTKAKNVWARYYGMIYNEAISGIWLFDQYQDNGRCLAGPATIFERKVFEDILKTYPLVKNSLSSDVSFGEAVYNLGIKQRSGPLIYCPVGEISFGDFMQKAKRYAFMAWRLPRRNLFYSIAMYQLIHCYIFIAIYALVSGKTLELYAAVLVYVSKLIYISGVNSFAEQKLTFGLDYIFKDIFQHFAFWWSLFSHKLSWSNVTYKIGKNGVMIKEA